MLDGVGWIGFEGLGGGGGYIYIYVEIEGGGGTIEDWGVGGVIRDKVTNGMRGRFVDFILFGTELFYFIVCQCVGTRKTT